MANPRDALYQRRLVLASALERRPDRPTEFEPLRTRSRVRIDAFEPGVPNSHRPGQGVPTLRGAIAERHSIVTSGASLVAIQRPISSGTAQGEVFAATIEPLPSNIARYTPFGVAAGGPQMGVRAALKKSALVYPDLLDRINALNRVRAELDDLMKEGQTEIDTDQASDIAEHLIDGGWSGGVVDRLLESVQHVTGSGWPVVYVEAMRDSIDKLLAGQREQAARELASPGAEAKVDTVMAYANSRLVEDRISPGFALYYGSCVARDTSAMDGRDGDPYAAFDEPPVVEVLVTQALDGSVNDLVREGWYGGRSRGVPPHYARINATLAGVIQALLAMQAEYDEVHNDLHAGNVLWERVSEDHAQVPSDSVRAGPTEPGVAARAHRRPQDVYHRLWTHDGAHPGTQRRRRRRRARPCGEHRRRARPRRAARSLQPQRRPGALYARLCRLHRRRPASAL